MIYHRDPNNWLGLKRVDLFTHPRLDYIHLGHSTSTAKMNNYKIIKAYLLTIFILCSIQKLNGQLLILNTIVSWSSMIHFIPESKPQQPQHRKYHIMKSCILYVLITSVFQKFIWCCYILILLPYQIFVIMNLYLGCSSYSMYLPFLSNRTQYIHYALQNYCALFYLIPPKIKLYGFN
uniref:Uncharacterized protein n=1 Tax=Cacopsylla melanoneura TaxID=428564 RepID=A0A8D9EGP9_9HEMI